MLTENIKYATILEALKEKGFFNKDSTMVMVEEVKVEETPVIHEEVAEVVAEVKETVIAPMPAKKSSRSKKAVPEEELAKEE